MEMTVWKMRIFDEGKIMAFFDLAYGELIIKGFKIVNGNQGIFISFPREQSKDGKWWDTVLCNSPMLAKNIETMAMDEYHKQKGV